MPAYLFAGHGFDPDTGELERPDGTRARLQPQPSQVLTLLLERAPGLVSREELQARVWPDTKVEFDQGINFCVRQIREALDESAAAPRFVETLPRRGYRFLPEVAREEDAGGPDAGPAVSGARPPSRRWLAPAAAAAAAVVVAAAAMVALRSPGETEPAAAASAPVRVAVLPFREGAGETPTAAGLALAEGVTLLLAADARLGVVGPASTRLYVGERAATDVVGKALSVDYVVSGSVEHRGDSTTFFGQLVRVSDLEHVWAERFNLPGPPSAGVPEAADRTGGRVLGFLAARDTGRTPSGIAWERTAPGASGDGGPAVVLVHGSNLDRRAWTEEARLLRGRRTVVRYDLRAHGASAGASSPWSDVDDLREVLDAADVARADLVGLSAGARVALDFALEHPERVRSLVLASPTVGGYRPAPEERPSFAPALGEALAAGDHARAAELLLETPVFRVDGPAAGWVARMVRENTRLWSVDPALAVRVDPPAVERLGEVRAPVLVVVGADDLLAVRRQAELLARALPDARRVEVPAGRHLLNLTDPEAFRAAVFPFLGLPAPGGR